MKFIKLLLISAVLGMCIGLIFDAREAYSAPRLGPSVTKTSRNEGDTRAGFNVALTSTSWTQVLASNPRRRNALVQTASSSGYSVCLSTFNTSAISCSATTISALIEPGGVLSDYSEGVLYGRVYDEGIGSVYARGLEYFDSGDHPSYQ